MAISVPTLIFCLISLLKIKSIECRAEKAELRVPTLTSSSLRVIHNHCMYAKLIEVARLDWTTKAKKLPILSIHD
jgi:hypothetical protein